MVLAAIRERVRRDIEDAHYKGTRCGVDGKAVTTALQLQPEYDDVVAEVGEFLRERIGLMEQVGIARERICIDPGLGFGKTLAHNIALLKNTRQMQASLQAPMLIGLSRKTMIGALTDRPVEQRMAGSLAGALAAVAQGARIVRVHDVAETVDALRVWQAVS